VDSILAPGRRAEAALARRIKVPSPSLFAPGGVLVALLPHGPRISLQPDLALALFVAPVLVDAAFDNSLRDLRQNWIPIASLVFMAVAVTTAAVAHTGSNTIAVASTLAFVLVGSIAVGAQLAFAYGNIVSRFSDVPSAIVMQFIGAFGAWIVADRLSLSGVLVVVTFAVILSRRSAIRLPAAVRVPSYAV
jgi:NhaP-type Na+/H+ or K+/H+ antiporter